MSLAMNLHSPTIQPTQTNIDILLSLVMKPPNQPSNQPNQTNLANHPTNHPTKPPQATATNSDPGLRRSTFVPSDRGESARGWLSPEAPVQGGAGESYQSHYANDG